MWKLKSCSRCGGDVFVDSDEHGDWYEQCLQCSYAHGLSLTEITEFIRSAKNGDEELVLAGARHSKRKSA
jgi:ribosomal protein S27AE